jgi:hypothetical protein
MPAICIGRIYHSILYECKCKGKARQGHVHQNKARLDEPSDLERHCDGFTRRYRRYVVAGVKQSIDRRYTTIEFSLDLRDATIDDHIRHSIGDLYRNQRRCLKRA